MAKMYEFPCGCRWPVVEEETPEGLLPLMDIDVESAPTDCPAAYKIIADRLTKGIFQLESPLGKVWSGNLKPNILEHMSALGAILRPGTLNAKDEDGISMTQHYCDRKNELEPIPFYSPLVDKILEESYGVMIYQEQMTAIAVAIASFTDITADMLRRAAGKKDALGMQACKTLFIDGAKKAGIITEKQAAELWDNIEKSNKYLFNRSHSACYGTTSYHTAYIKAHNPLAFYIGWLYNACNKTNPTIEVMELVNDSRLMDIDICVPDLRDMEENFYTDRRKIHFGITNIKGFGDAEFTKLRKAVTENEEKIGKPLGGWTWLEFLVNCSHRIGASLMVKLIQVGAFGWLGIPRCDLFADFRAFDGLTEKEKDWFPSRIGKYETFAEALLDAASVKKDGGAAHNSARLSAILSHRDLILNPRTARKDTPHEIASNEAEHLGISLTCARIDSCDTSMANCTCKEYLDGKTGFLMVAAEISSVKIHKTKTGKNPGATMAFLTVSDHTCSLGDVVCFPDVYEKHGHLLTQKNTVILQVERDKAKGSVIVKQVYQTSIG